MKLPPAVGAAEVGLVVALGVVAGVETLPLARDPEVGEELVPLLPPRVDPPAGAEADPGAEVSLPRVEPPAGAEADPGAEAALPRPSGPASGTMYSFSLRL